MHFTTNVFSFMLFIIVLSHLQFLGGASNEYLHDNKNSTTSAAIKSPFNSHTNHSFQDNVQQTSCRPNDLRIAQSQVGFTGIPLYAVEIINGCLSEAAGCQPSKVHLHCDWFASARFINPKVFKRLSYDDCLVNDGKSFKSGQMISFSYANTHMYPLALKHAQVC
ncbi:hypothetical protein SSX86_022446 [Deinandra increscens subsp. villosa]|uniref:Uncharacterized protein n=1 Tax=Deinandra increscens subsp. villosa TaxID=3103831 RepID=A0AAP0CJ22_9ASTR